MTTKHIIVTYHGGCPDGMGAAFAAFLRFGDRAEYVPVFHTEPFPELGDLFGKTVYCLDYCPKQPDLLRLIQGANSVILLDHHDGVAARTEELFRTRMLNGMVSEDHSGAVMAWNLFFPRLPAPMLLQYIEDRDIWAWKLPHARELLAAVDSYPLDMGTWQKLVDRVERDARGLIQEGAPILRYHQQLVHAAVQTARMVDFMGYSVMAASTHGWLDSDVGNALAKGFDFSVVYYDLPGQRKFSLRSSQDGANVGEICTALGGGGHAHAGGCQVPFDRLTVDGMPRYLENYE